MVGGKAALFSGIANLVTGVNYVHQRINGKTGMAMGSVVGLLLIIKDYANPEKRALFEQCSTSEQLSGIALVTLGYGLAIGFCSTLYRDVRETHYRNLQQLGEELPLDRLARDLSRRAERARFWEAYRS